jgi:hypothetical protein
MRRVVALPGIENTLDSQNDLLSIHRERAFANIVTGRKAAVQVTSMRPC